MCSSRATAARGTVYCCLVTNQTLLHIVEGLFVFASSPFQSLTNNMAGNERLDLVHQNAVQVEQIRKLQRHQNLHTEFSINPHRKCKLYVSAEKSCHYGYFMFQNNEFIAENVFNIRQLWTNLYLWPPHIVCPLPLSTYPAWQTHV